MDILPQLLVNALISGSIYALVSSGLALMYGLQRILNFAHGHLMMAGAYAFYFAYVMHEWSLATASLFTLAVTLVLTLLTLFVFVTPFLRFSVFLPFVTTLALATILESTVSMGFGVNVKSLTIGMDINSIELYGVYITPVQIIIILTSIILLTLLAYVIHYTGFGRKVRALSANPFAAQTLGIDERRVTFVVFAVGMILASIAGVLIGFETNLQPTMGGSYTIKAFAAMILGGLGNIWGTVLGAYLLGIVENLSIGLDFGGYSLPAGYRDAFAFMIILLMLLIKPSGLFGTKTRES